MRVFKILSLSLLLFALAGCNLPEPKDRAQGGGGASFMVSSADGNWGDSDNHQKFSIPRARLINYEVCLQDLARLRPISGQSFEIQEVKLTRTSDARGCVSWSEKLEFNYLASSTSLRLERHLTAKGLARGTVTVAFGVNPWSHGESALQQIVDLDKASVKDLLTDATEVRQHLRGQNQEETASSQLWLEDARLVVTDDRLVPGGFQITHQIVGAPRLILRKASGDRVLQVLTRGVFNVDVYLIHQDIVDGREVRRAFAVQNLREVEMSNDSLAIRAPFLLPEVPKSGQIFVGMKLEPVGAPEGLRPFIGLYPVGDHRSIKTGGFMKLSSFVMNNPKFQFEDFLTDDASLKSVKPLISPSGETVVAPGTDTPKAAEDVTGTLPHFQRASVEVERLQISPLQRGRETSQRQEIKYRVKACLSNSVDQDALKVRPFQVSLFRVAGQESSESLSITTDNTSCLNWDETFEFDSYACQHYIKGSVEIKNSDLGFNQRIEYFLNPWAFNGVLGVDARDIPRVKNLTTECKPGQQMAARLHFDGYSFSTVSYDYEVDRGLNLSLRKKVAFRADPQVLLYSSLSNGIEERRSLRDGSYVLRVLVLRNKDYDSNNTYVTHSEKVVNVLGGKISAEMEFVSQDLKAVGNRNTMLLELHAADPAKIQLDAQGRPSPKGSLQVRDVIAAGENSSGAALGGIFRGTIILNQESSSSPLEVLDQSAQAQFLAGASVRENSERGWMTAMIEAGLKLRSEQVKKLSTVESGADFARRHGFHFISPKLLAQKGSLAKALSVTQLDHATVPMFERFRPEFWNSLKEKATLIESKEIAALAKGELTKEMAFRLCSTFAYELLKDRTEPTRREALTGACWRMVHGDPRSVFALSRREVVHSFEKAEFVGGSPKNLTVSNSFSLSKSHSDSYSVRTQIGGGFEVGFDFLKFFSLGVSGGMSLDWATTDTDTRANSVTVSENTLLSVRETKFRLRVTGLEKCVVVRLQPSVFEKKAFWKIASEPSFLSYFKESLSAAELAEGTQRPLVVCSDEVEKSAQDRMESYFLIYQDAPGGDVLDAADPRNRPFFIALRGRADYQRFINVIKGNAQLPMGAGAEDLNDDALVTFLKTHFSTAPLSPGHLVLDGP